MIAVIDYGAGNLRSICNACRHLGYEATLVSGPEGLSGADKIILPGVGNFGRAMEGLDVFRGVIYEEIGDGTPFLGICLGIQVMFERSDEAPDTKGLGLYKGGCVRFQGDVKVPHMGWNTLSIKRDSPLLRDIPDESLFYFVHSFYPVPEDPSIIQATTDYGVTFPSVVGRGNVYATQFHPEKSGLVGLRLLRNFLEL